MPKEKKEKKDIVSKPLEGVNIKAEKEEALKTKIRASTFYIGPGVQRGILDKGAVFIGTLPKEVEDLKIKYPSIVPLFVSEKEYVEAFNEVKKSGTITNILFNKAVEEVMN